MKPTYFLVLVAICAIWGLHFSVVKVAIEEIPPMFYVSIRMAIVTAILSPFLKWHPGQMSRLLIGGFGFGGVNHAFMFTGVKMTTASLGAVLIETYMCFATLLSVIILKEKVGWRRVTGIVLAFAGVAVIVSAGGDALAAENLVLGATLIITGALLEAGVAVAVKSLDGVSPFQMLAWFCLVGFVVVTPISLVVESGHLAVLQSDSRLLIGLGIAYSVILSSLFGHGAYYWLLQRVPISQVAGATVMTTLFAVGFGVLLLGDPLTPRFIIGAAMTVIGVGIIVARAGKKGRDVVAREADVHG